MRVSGGHLCAAEAPTEAAAETLTVPHKLSLPLDGDDSPQCGEMSRSDKGDRRPSGGGPTYVGG